MAYDVGLVGVEAGERRVGGITSSDGMGFLTLVMFCDVAFQDFLGVCSEPCIPSLLN